MSYQYDPRDAAQERQRVQRIAETARLALDPLKRAVADIEAERRTIGERLNTVYTNLRASEATITATLQEAIRSLQRAASDTIAAAASEAAQTIAECHSAARDAKARAHKAAQDLARAERAVRKLEKEC